MFPGRPFGKKTIYLLTEKMDPKPELKSKHYRKFFSQQWNGKGAPTSVKEMLLGHYGGRAGYGEVPTYQNGKFIKVRALVDGREELEFPEPVGKQVVYHVGHPEPITLSRYIDGVEYVDNKGMVFPPSIRDSILKMGDMGLLSQESIDMGDVSVRPVDFAAAFLFEKVLETDTSVEPALRVEVDGKEDGKTTRYIFSGVGETAEATSIPASVGAQMVA